MDEQPPLHPTLDESRPQRARLTSLQKVEFMRSVDLFSQATVEELLRLAAIAGEIHFDAAETIFREGDIADALYLVLEGQVELTRAASAEAGVIAPGQAVGIYSVLTREPRYFTVRALQDTFALKILAEDFYDLLSHNTEILFSIFKLFIRKIGLGRGS